MPPPEDWLSVAVGEAGTGVAGVVVVVEVPVVVVVDCAGAKGLMVGIK